MIKLLDHGFIKVIDKMGNDAAITQAARVSYGEGTKTVKEDKALIHYLLKHKHTSPFEQCSIKLHLKMPIFVARQWVRHRTAKMNEYSARYSIVKDDFYIPSIENIGKQSSSNKQGTELQTFSESEAIIIQNQIKILSESAYELYQNLISKGVSREIARIVLPLNVYTEFYWKMDLHNLLHFLTLRCDKHAQYEIRIYAEKILEIVKEWVPFTYESYENCVIKGVNFTSEQLEFLKNFCERFDFTDYLIDTDNLNKRDKQELLEKLK